MSFTLEATERLNQQAPELGKLVLAFKDLTDELPEDSGVQVGLFIVKTGESYIYVPVLAKAGTVQPLDSMFCATTKTFVPLTKKSVEWIINSNSVLGSATKIPTGVVKDPNLYDAIVPPKTGKMSYASEGRVSGFLETLPNHIKQAMVDTLGRDLSVKNAINKVMDFNRVFMGPLERKTPEYIPPANTNTNVEVITGGKDLSDSEVQEVLSKGYTVRNSPTVGSVAVESSGANTWTTAESILPGSAYTAIQKNGEVVTVMALDKVPSANSEALDKAGNLVTGSGEGRVLLISTNGDVYQDHNIVVMQQEQDFSAASKELAPKFTSISSAAPTLSSDSKVLIQAGTRFIGPVDIITVEKANGWTTLSVDDQGTPKVIKVHDSIKTDFNQIGNQILLSPDATILKVSNTPKDIETDINTAEFKYNAVANKMLPVQANVMHRDGVYAIDGAEVGDRPTILSHMLTSWGLDVATAESFIESAKNKSSIMIKMAAVRGGGRPSQGKGTSLSEIPEIGEKAPSTISMTGDARQRAMGMAGKINQAAEVNDREVMEATIISQILQNPDMHGSIQEYLPEIKSAVDKLGRTLFLMRINTQKLSETIEAEALNNLLTSTRNSYRILGETYVELSNLSPSE